MRMRIALAALIGFVLPGLALAELPIQAVKSPGGINAWLIEDHAIPFVALEIRFKGGTALDPADQRGAVNLMTALLEEGTGDLDAQAFAKARDDLAAEFRFGSDIDTVSVSARFLSEYREPSLALLRGAIVAPRFDAEAVERVRGQVLANLRSDASDPEAIAADTFDRLAFGMHPYGSSGDGTEESVAALSREDLIAAHRGAMALDRVYVSAAGDITAEQLGALLDDLLGELPAKGAAPPPAATFALGGGVTVVDFPTPQSVIRFGSEGIARDDPDFFAAFVMNEVLGGSRFNARLMTEVREKRGLTYGIGTYLAPMDHGAMYLGQFATANATAGQAMDVVRDEWAKLARDGITAEELERTKTYLTGAYALRFDGNGPIARILVGMQLQDLPIAYAETRNDKVNAVTLDDVARVTKRLIQPDKLHFVVVGQPEGVVSTP